MLGRILQACCCRERRVGERKELETTPESPELYVHVSTASPLPPHYRADPVSTVRSDLLCKCRVSLGGDGKCCINVCLTCGSDKQSGELSKLNSPQPSEAPAEEGVATQRQNAKERLKKIVRNFVASCQVGLPVSIAEGGNPNRLSPAVFKVEKSLAFSVSRSNTVVESDLEFVDYHLFSTVTDVQRGFVRSAAEDVSSDLSDLAVTILLKDGTRLHLLLSDKWEQERFFISLSILRMSAGNSS